jgi:clan AA aspartic protease
MTPTARIDVIGSRQAETLTAIVDTGFDGDFCLPTRHAVQLGLELIGEQIVELADGTRRKELMFAGSVRFLGTTREVKLMLTNSEDALIGTRLMNHYPASIDFPGGHVKLRQRRETGGRRPSRD